MREGGKIMQNLIWSVSRLSQFDYSHTIRPIRVNSASVPNGFSVSSSHLGGKCSITTAKGWAPVEQRHEFCGYRWWTAYKVLYTDHKPHIIGAVVITDEEKQSKTNKKKNMKVLDGVRTLKKGKTPKDFVWKKEKHKLGADWETTKKPQKQFRQNLPILYKMWEGGSYTKWFESSLYYRNTQKIHCWCTRNEHNSKQWNFRCCESKAGIGVSPDSDLRFSHC